MTITKEQIQQLGYGAKAVLAGKTFIERFTSSTSNVHPDIRTDALKNAMVVLALGSQDQILEKVVQSLVEISAEEDDAIMRSKVGSLALALCDLGQISVEEIRKSSNVIKNMMDLLK